ncbi:MAG: SIS domain-containing protein [Oscillospiraceae bacterium]|nr:SIS domain-containing protein [Oscillospiraceae bacterium]
MNSAAKAYVADFYAREDGLADTRAALEAAVTGTLESYAKGGKLLTAGNGGSAADAEHITGELLKSFRCRRPLSAAFAAEYERLFGGEPLPAGLEGSLPAIFLGGNFAVATAIVNDLGGEALFAQQAMGLCAAGDVLLCVSTSGDAKPLLAAMRVAKAKRCTCVALTGRGGGAMRALADVCIQAPAEETYLVQEQHIKLYHTYCAAIEAHYWGSCQ